MSKPDDPNKERDEGIKEELRRSGMANIRAQLSNPNIKEASKQVEAHAGQDWDRAFAPEVEPLKRDRELHDTRTKSAGEELYQLEEQKRATKSHLDVAEIKVTGENNTIPFWEWDFKDQLNFISSILFMVLVLFAGSGNVFSAIMAEAQQVFIDTPILAILLACLFPSGSLALHSLGDLLGSDRSRERYIRAILVLTILCLLVWVVLFGLTFQIGDSGINWKELESQEDHMATVFTIVQLLAELLCGTSLGLIASHIHSRYHGNTTISNPKKILLGEQIADRLPGFEANHDLSKMAWGRWMQLQAMREVHISEQVALFIAMRRRFDDSNPV